MLLSTGQFFSQAASPLPPGWVPADLGATLRAWYKGDELTGSDTDPLDTWADGSGNANDATQGNAADKPTLDVAELNGLNVVRFTAASTQWFDLPNLLSGASAASAYLVIKVVADPPASSATAGMWTWNGGSASHYPFTNGSILDQFCTSRKTVGNVAPSLAAWRIVGVHSVTGDYRYRIDGISMFNTSSNTFSVVSAPHLGQSDGAGTPQAWLNGWIAELVIVDSVLSDANREKMEGYLAHKWGLTGNLDAGHPYKSVAP